MTRAVAALVSSARTRSRSAPVGTWLRQVALVLGAAASGGASLAPASTGTAASVRVYQTTQDVSEHLNRLHDLSFSAARPSGRVIDVNDATAYQRVIGLGGSMTDSSAWLIDKKLSATTRAWLTHLLFTSRGIGLNFLRVPMGASDFTAGGRPYSYDDLPAGQTDPQLRRFSIGHDRAYIIPALKAALHENRNLDVLANPWSPPAWMKTNNSMNSLNPQNQHGTLRHADYPVLANYFVRFLRAYAQAGVRVSKVTPQNEPDLTYDAIIAQTVANTYPGMDLPRADQETFLLKYLQPALVAAGLKTGIYGNDASWDRINYVQSIIRNANSALSGISWHCYAGTPVSMSLVHRLYPHLDQIVDECSPEILGFSTMEFLISSFRNWATSVSEWNLALDPSGGPVQAPNGGCGGCNGVVTIDPRTHKVAYGRKYYQMGQIGRFVSRGAHRIDTNSFTSYSGTISHFSPSVDNVAFRNPDGSDVLVTYNNGSTSSRFVIEWHHRYFAYTEPAGAATTFVWR
jgi:glucosylceramidase